MTAGRHGSENASAKSLKRFIFPAVSLLVGLMVSIAIVEVFLRNFVISPVFVTSADQATFDKVPGIYQPVRTSVSYANANLPHSVTINDLGYRGSDFPRAKPKDELRVFMAGDSFTFGDLVSDNETMPYQLEQLLLNRCKKVRVINGGLAGSTIVAHSALIRRALALNPDIVILTWHDNDLGDLRYPIWNTLAANRKLRSSFPFTWHAFMMRNSSLYVLAKDAYSRFKLRQQVTASAEAKQADVDAEIEFQRRLKSKYGDILQGVDRQLREHGIDFLYVLFPAHLNLHHRKPASSTAVPGDGYWYSARLNTWAEKNAQGLGIPTLNLRSALLEQLANPAQDGYLLPHDGHPSPKGYGVAAKTIANFAALRRAVENKCPMPTPAKS